jgi:pimeloyl-ACP methyl ester carboxylesterase
MRKTELRDLLVFLPGIGGSVLQKDNDVLWAPSIGVAWQLLTRPSAHLAPLRLHGDDPERETLDDGVRAVGLVRDLHVIPGLWKIDGYSGFRNMLLEAFELEAGTASDEDTRVANYYEFPYDWRRDNRASARRLQRFVEQRLHRWRVETAFRDARVIVIAHSMGGLVARYYLDVLGGWTDCRALVTIGTPFRGSVKALNVLSNGHRVLFTDFTEVVRSLTSVYQLLPRYEMVEDNGSYRRIADPAIAIPGVEHERARDALRFHEEIDDAQRARPQGAYELIPIVGTWQPTLQSARLVQGRLIADVTVPTWTTFPEGEGDGTVPRVSAVPIESSGAWLNTFVAERHATLQNHGGVLQDLQDRLIQSQVRTDHIRGAVAERPKPALSLDIEDLYALGEPIAVRVAARNVDEADITNLRATVESVGGHVPVAAVDFVSSGQRWEAVLPPLAPGGYRVAVTARGAPAHTPDPVHDIFLVTDA